MFSQIMEWTIWAELIVQKSLFRQKTIVAIKHARKPFDMNKQGSLTRNLRKSGCLQTLVAHRGRLALWCKRWEVPFQMRSCWRETRCFV